MLESIGKFIKAHGFPTFVAVAFAISSWKLLGRLDDAYKKLGQAEERTQSALVECMKTSVQEHEDTRAVVRKAMGLDGGVP